MRGRAATYDRATAGGRGLRDAAPPGLRTPATRSQCRADQVAAGADLARRHAPIQPS